MTNTPELTDCAGCTDPRSEGTHAMRTKQHPGNTPEQEEWRVTVERWDEGVVLKAKNSDGSGAGAVMVNLPLFMADAIIADHAAATALDVVVKALQELEHEAASSGSNLLRAQWVQTRTKEALSHPAVVARLAGK